MGKPLFLDRDGVLNEDITPYVSHLSKLNIFPYTVNSLVRLSRAGFDLYVVSNQQGVSLGITPASELEAMVALFQELLRPFDVQIKKFYHCTALDSERHPWRKPSPGMILSAAEEFGFDPTGAFMVGDKWSDLEAGARAGCRPLLVLSGVTHDDESWQTWNFPPEQVFATLAEATDWILDQGTN